VIPGLCKGVTIFYAWTARNRRRMIPSKAKEETMLYYRH
jgi:hypothetical protein